MEGISVKVEPVELPIEVETKDYINCMVETGPQCEAPGDVPVPEFINIKTEIDLPSYDASIEATPEEDPASFLDKPDGDWLVEDINIKVEPDDFYNSESDEDLSVAGPTTSNEGFDANTDCRICFKRFANPGNVQRHMLLHAEKKHHCTECPKQFLTKEQLDKHSLRHACSPSKRPYICEHCNKQFKSSSNLMQHKRIHLTVKPFFCTQCHRTFAFKANLTKHQGKSRCKRPIDEPIKCHVCNKIFEKEFLLKSHLRRHETDRPFACEQCTMAFKYKSTLIRHIQLHEGIRPYSCPVCDKTFTHSGLLKPHMRVHTGEKPYECPTCNKAFAHKHNMQRHAIRHNKIKHLVCDICHKQFPKESRLKYHMRIHVNEKHFSCQICPKKFSHKQNVLRHYTRKHPNAKYECKDTDASVALKVWDTIKSKYAEDPGEILG